MEFKLDKVDNDEKFRKHVHNRMCMECSNRMECLKGNQLAKADQMARCFDSVFNRATEGKE